MPRWTNDQLPAAFAAARDDPGLAVLEGFHALKHALRFGASAQHVVAIDPQALEDLARDLAPDLFGRLAAVARPVPVPLFRQLAKNPPPTGVVAIAARPPVDVDAALAGTAPAVFLEHPRHLGNVGAVIRVAAAAGAACVLTSGEADPWDAAAIRGSAGLHFALPVAHVAGLPLSDRPLIAVDPDGDDLTETPLPPRPILAFGTERHGLTEEFLNRADLRVRIPMRPGVSSLNLATAVAITLYAHRPTR